MPEFSTPAIFSRNPFPEEIDWRQDGSMDFVTDSYQEPQVSWCAGIQASVIPKMRNFTNTRTELTKDS